jgi:hypothetical protein
MPDVVYAMSQRHHVFDGTDAPALLAAIQVTYPDAVISASANYPGASAMVSVDPYSGYTLNFAAGDSWGYATNGQYPGASLADPNFGVPLEAYVTAVAGPIATAAASAAVAAIPQPALAVGYEITPNLLAGASATVQVPMVPGLPDAGYNVAVALAGSSQLLGSLQIIGHTVVSASAVNVSVQNTNGLLTLGGATVLVTALHNG